MASCFGVKDYLRGLLVVLLLMVASVSQALSQEVITSFDAQIELSKDGDMTVTETISVIAEGRDISRGIYRDFPRYFLGEGGALSRVKFDIVSVLRNGQSENYHTQYIDNQTRIYIGEEDIFIPRGAHTYTIVYETDRQIGFIQDGEELYWNVTGNGWTFPIEKASATITLKEGGSFENFEFFTGASGSTDTNARAEARDNGQTAFFETTAPLASRQGLTIVAIMARGTINEPTESQLRWWFMRDFGHVVVGVITLIVVALYYIIAWLLIGRDPKGGRIEQRKTLSLGISPALTHYIANKGSLGGGWIGISAAILNLAVKEHILIEKEYEDPVLVQNKKPVMAKLPVGEAAIMSMVQERGIERGFALSKSNGAQVAKLRSNFQKAIENEHRNVFYERNSMWIFIGIGLSVIGILSTLIFNADGFFALIISAVITILWGAAFIPAYFLARRILRSQSTAVKVIGLTFTGLFVLVLLTFLGAVVISILLEGQSWFEFLFIGAVLGLILLNIAFFHLMGRPTALGAEMMNQIEGLRLHLMNYHEERMNRDDVPDMSPEYFEKLLPYAVALNVEKPWSGAFETWLASAAAVALGASHYDPYWDRHRWYRDRHHNNNRNSGFGDHMASTLSSAMPQPQSSSSSGGSSGGGGGGGGGGGW